MRKQKSTDKVTSDNSKLTPGEWNRIFNKSLTTYKAAIWQLIAIIELGSSKFGRDKIVEMTPFDEKKVNLYNKLARLKSVKCNELLPEVAYELTVLKNDTEQRDWYNKVIKENLKASKLRKSIRKSRLTPSLTQPKTPPMPHWPRHLTMLTSELNKLSPENRERAKVILRQQLNAYYA